MAKTLIRFLGGSQINAGARFLGSSMAQHTGAQNQRDVVEIRLATSDDARDIWEWRNDDVTKKMSINTGAISWDVHIKWYEKTLLDDGRYIYIGCLGGDKIGVCIFNVNVDRNSAEVSINLNPKYRNRGLSHQLLAEAIKIFLHEKNISLVATIKKINKSSERCFLRVGFVFDREDGEFGYYKLIS
jgi:L-amino acid N-acyltransferase YncA